MSTARRARDTESFPAQSRRFCSAVCVVFALVAGCKNDAPSGDGWRVSTPARQGMDAAVLEGARTYAFAEGKYTQGVVVVRHGSIVAEWYADGASVDSYAASWSMAKSFTSALVGIALEEGLIPSLDVSMATYIPSWAGTDKAAITLRDVLTMSSGLDWNETYGLVVGSDILDMVFAEGSSLAVVVDEPVLHPPGTVFNYSSGDTMLLSAVLEQATGMSAGAFAEERLFAPLGLEHVDWWQDTTGQTLTYCCLDMRSRDFARFGQLYLDGGARDGRQIVPASWVTASLEPSSAWEGYGFKWWLLGRTDAGVPADTYEARGHDGQHIYVIPSLDLVVVRNGTYVKSPEAPIATPYLFTRYPSDNIVDGEGTRAPDTWSHAAFLAPIVASITDP